jgi:hypothetical protein
VPGWQGSPSSCPVNCSGRDRGPFALPELRTVEIDLNRFALFPFLPPSGRDMPGATALRSRVAVAAACLAVVAAAAVLLHRRRRRNRAPASPRRFGWRRRRSRRTCEEEEKPQGRFKRVLADNSYSAFKHLRRQGGQAGGEATPTLPEGTRC